MTDKPEVPVAPLAKAPAVPEEELHRRRTKLARAADKRHDGAGWVVYQWWRERNETLFGRQMQTCEIRFEEVSGGCRFGEWRGRDNKLILDRSLIHRHGHLWRLYHEDLGQHFVADVLLHQMVHQYIDTVRHADAQRRHRPVGPVQKGNQTENAKVSRHDTRSWIAEINRLTEKLDLGPRRAAVNASNSTAMSPTEQERRGDLLSKTEVACWPYVLRADGYYRANPADVIDLSNRGNDL